MKLPIKHSTSWKTGSAFFDADEKVIECRDICDAVNNAAAGPWQKGEFPEGKDGDVLLLSSATQIHLYALYIGYYWNGAWRGKGGLVIKRGCRWAHLNMEQPKKEEGATE